VIRVAFTLIGGSNWTGGYNYLLNLLTTLTSMVPLQVQPVLFIGEDLEAKILSPLEAISGVQIVRNLIFNESNKSKRLCQALLFGCDLSAKKIFKEQGIQVVFENAQFYGWLFPLPTVSWIPDFQHRYLKHLFNFKSYWKRELGFRAQILSGRHIMLSSDDARQDFEKFYPGFQSRTHVVHFAVLSTNNVDTVTARIIADSYGLPEYFFFLPNQFWIHKNHECVIQALRILKSRGRDLVIAASGKQEDPRDPGHFLRLKFIIESNDLDQNFRLLDLIPHTHVSALMMSCVALINPSLFEGWSTTVEEAKAMGTPMILSSLRVHREQSHDALFFDASSPNELASILDEFYPVDHLRRESMRVSAVHMASSSFEKFGNEFVKLIEQIVKKK
jgi:glycosyltransferase involved in cell wall biosynthesis